MYSVAATGKPYQELDCIGGPGGPLKPKDGTNVSPRHSWAQRFSASASSAMVNTFILKFGYRRVVVFSDQCKQYSVSQPCRPPVGLLASLT